MSNDDRDLKILDTRRDLTEDELKELKWLAGLTKSMKIFIAIVLGAAGVFVALTDLLDAFHKAPK